MIAAYWDGDIAEIEPFLDEWKKFGVDIRVFGDEDVIPLLREHDENVADIFPTIEIPACKSDVARLALLYRYGGLYVDAHVGPGDFAALSKSLGYLAEYEIVLFDQTWKHAKDGDVFLVNTVMIARQRSPIVGELLQLAGDNLLNQFSVEKSAGAYVSYNIYVLTGAALFGRFIEIKNGRADIAPLYAARVRRERLYSEPAPSPFTFYRFYGYRQPGKHWSERQKSEPLFATTTGSEKAEPPLESEASPAAPLLNVFHKDVNDQKPGDEAEGAAAGALAVPCIIDLTSATDWGLFAKRGIAAPEVNAGGAWTCDELAQLRIKLNCASEVQVVFELWPFILAGKLPEQIVRVRINGALRARWVFDEAAWQRRSVIITPHESAAPNTIAIDLLISTATSPRALKSGPDQRRLGILIRRVELKIPSGAAADGRGERTVALRHRNALDEANGERTDPIALKKGPFELIRCSWPRPVEQRDGSWVTEPDWTAPAMPVKPTPRRALIDETPCWLIDWREFFRVGLSPLIAGTAGDMRLFHVIFEILINEDGTLAFWDDDSCIIRRADDVIYENRRAHPVQRSTLSVRSGDRLMIAQWQMSGDWKWAAAMLSAKEPSAAFPGAFLPEIIDRVQRPSGPPLKCFIQGNAHLRTILSLYSLILNGYSPEKVILFGEHQWSPQARSAFAHALPFAEVVPTERLMGEIYAHGGRELANWADQYWWVMKTCVAFLCPPFEFCGMDDDVFVINPVQDALNAFAGAELVYAADRDYGREYQDVWEPSTAGKPLPTARFNAGIYWMRTSFDPDDVARRMLTVNPGRVPSLVWEQGIIATLFAGLRTVELPSQRYFFPALDGLPGGTLGYDYLANPCGFTTVHFGGLHDKPGDAVARLLFREILGRRRA
jgi:Glycosyltransferase sugar-binding region containing DXD motif